METARVVELILVAIVLGALLPSLLELRAVLKAARKLLEGAGPQIERAATEAEGALARLHKLIPEDGGPKVDELLTSVAELARGIDQLRGQIRTAASIGAAVGPAVASAVRAYRESQHRAGAVADERAGENSRNEERERDRERAQVNDRRTDDAA